MKIIWSRGTSKATPVILVVALFLLVGCAAPKEKPVRVLWPAPPETPKIEFIGAYASEQDFPKDEMSRLTDAMLGEDPEYKFKTPFGIVADAKGRVYVSDLHLKNVRIYDFEKRDIHFLIKDPMFMTPMGMALDAQDNLYIADGSARKIWVFNAERIPVKAIGEKFFKNPVFLAVNDRLGRLYVADSKAHQIHVLDLTSHEHLFSFGTRGEGEGELSYPLGLAIDTADNLFVADRMNARIQVFDAEGNFLYFFGERGDQTAAFEAPRDLAFDGEGNLWVVDSRRAAIYTYTKEGRILLETGGQQRSVARLGFSSPSAVSIDRNDRIYVADKLNKRFVVWQYLSPKYLETNPITAEDLQRIKQAIDEAARANRPGVE